ncbi:MAG TPA: hypothetical protein VNG31_07990 [Candidatus Baltobacteraceae bacterium]|nr:hypothetical protein [Candidatus Baltobacteraceae bacterium]
MTIFAGLFLLIFGAFGTWFLATRFPSARFMRVAYAAMAVGGALFVIWGFVKLISIGVAAVAVLAAGGAIGAFGALRRELRPGR